MSRKGKRYDTEPKLNYKKVFAVIIAIVVILVAVVLMFLLIWTNMRKHTMTLEDSKIKNKDIRKQLDEIKELERRRKELDNPYE